MIKNLNIRAKTIKHSEENRDVNVTVGLGNDFLDMLQKHKHQKKQKQAIWNHQNENFFFFFGIAWDLYSSKSLIRIFIFFFFPQEAHYFIYSPTVLYVHLWAVQKHFFF